MKKMIAALLAVFCLAGCAAQSAPETEQAPPAVTETQPAPAETPADAPETDGAPLAPVEVPLEKPDEDTAEHAPAEDEKPEPASYTSVVKEGLAGDAVGYSLVLPSFGYEAFDRFYEELIAHLTEYAQQTVHEECLKRNCVASVFGSVTSADYVGGKLTVGYELRVEFSDSEEPLVNTRTDTFDPETGDLASSTR